MLVGAINSVYVALLASSKAYLVVVRAVADAQCSGHALVMRHSSPCPCEFAAYGWLGVCGLSEGEYGWTSHACGTASPLELSATG